MALCKDFQQDPTYDSLPRGGVGGFPKPQMTSPTEPKELLLSPSKNA